MSRVPVELEIIPILHDVDFALCRPWVAEQPEGRPSTTRWFRQVGEVGDKEAMVISG